VRKRWLGIALALVILILACLLCPRHAGSELRAAPPWRSYLPLVLGAYPRPNPTPTGTPAPTPTPAPWPTARPEDCAHAPTLIAPANGALLNTLIPELECDPGGVVPDRVSMSISQDEAPHMGFGYLWTRPQRRTAWRIGENLEPAQTYHWDGYAVCGPVHSPLTPRWSFTTGSGGIILPAPALTTPISGTVLVGRQVTLQWSAVPGAVEYQLLWTPLPILSYVASRTRGTSVTLQSWNLAPHSTYEWSVQARNDYAWGDESERRRFTTGE